MTPGKAWGSRHSLVTSASCALQIRFLGQGLGTKLLPSPLGESGASPSAPAGATCFSRGQNSPADSPLLFAGLLSVGEAAPSRVAARRACAVSRPSSLPLPLAGPNVLSVLVRGRGGQWITCPGHGLLSGRVPISGLPAPLTDPCPPLSSRHPPHVELKLSCQGFGLNQGTYPPLPCPHPLLSWCLMNSVPKGVREGRWAWSPAMPGAAHLACLSTERGLSPVRPLHPPFLWP